MVLFKDDAYDEKNTVFNPSDKMKTEIIDYIQCNRGFGMEMADCLKKTVCFEKYRDDPPPD